MMRAFRTSIAIWSLVSFASARGADSPGSAPAPSSEDDASSAPPTPPPRTVPRPAPALPQGGLDFELLGQPAQKANPALEASLERRRTMLTLHPALGIATWAGLAATTIVGQLDFDDRFGGGGDTGKYHGWHTGLAIGTSALFLTTGLLAVLAPKPFDTGGQVDTALVHKIAMGAATAGMVAQIVLGIVARGRAGSVDERRIASAHQIIGYGTLAAYTVGATVWVF